ncbi:hypothetical protein ACU6U9_14805 [Pseudomonas sp. HK3]
MKFCKYITFIFILVSHNSLANEYHCKAVEKYSFSIKYTKDIMSLGQFSTRIEEIKKNTYLSRCSMSFKFRPPEIRCVRYLVDKIEYDKNIRNKKYYIFKEKIDFQIFSDFSSIENDGKGSVQFGECKVSPL